MPPSKKPAAKQQGQLSFAARRGGSLNDSRGKGKAPARASSSEAAIGRSTEPSESDDAEVGQKRKTVEKGEDEGAQKKAKRIFDSREGEENAQDVAGRPAEEAKEQFRPQKLDLKDKKWAKPYRAAREKMGNLEPIHAKDQNKAHHILRVFDLSYEYGPCVGVTRIERWERAEALGLNPPSEVKDILLTKEGLEEDGYKQCVFYEYEV
ncbi:hypothetical protein EIP91_009261 [Steccherinum ochraceum]|uniref:DNA polymerase delta subunit 4 n=1 Tax=Steccherinum ochraceum TaxID=92696 RepID=A0A4R0R451_9APHY|nr:hypothetical protein EIP91_009261 [Steccherinum ochraceum]